MGSVQGIYARAHFSHTHEQQTWTCWHGGGGFGLVCIQSSRMKCGEEGAFHIAVSGTRAGEASVPRELQTSPSGAVRYCTQWSRLQGRHACRIWSAAFLFFFSCRAARRCGAHRQNSKGRAQQGCLQHKKTCPARPVIWDGLFAGAGFIARPAPAGHRLGLGTEWMSVSVSRGRIGGPSPPQDHAPTGMSG